MKKSEFFFELLLVPLDAVAILLGFISAYFIRSSWEIIPVSYLMPLREYLLFVVKFIPFWLIVLAIQGLYSPQRIKRGFNQFVKISIAAAAGILLFILWAFLTRNLLFSRLVIIYSLFSTIFFLTLVRELVDWFQVFLFRFGIGVRRLAFVGVNPVTLSLAKEIQREKFLGYKVLGFFSTNGSPRKSLELKKIGTLSLLPKALSEEKIDEIVLTTKVPPEKITEIQEICRENRVAFKIVPSFSHLETANISYLTLAGIPIIEFKPTPLEGWGRVAKRTFDFVFSLLVLIILSPLILIIGLAIKLTSRGPIIYRNERVGPQGTFETFKFRTMSVEYSTGHRYGGKNAEALEEKLIRQKNIKRGPVYKIPDDPRVTPLGQFLRRTSLDEVPQFLNVLRGEMSVVGPRPHQPREVAKYKKSHRKLLLVKPGISGMAQVSGRSDLEFEEEANLDIYYIENWSLWLDLTIIFKTMGVVFRGKGAY